MKIVRELEEESASAYNFNAMRHAMNRSLSFWRSHTGREKREKFVRPVEAAHSAVASSKEEEIDERVMTEDWKEWRGMEEEESKEDLEDEMPEIETSELPGHPAVEDDSASTFHSERTRDTEEETEPAERTATEEEEEESEEDYWSGKNINIIANVTTSLRYISC